MKKLLTTYAVASLMLVLTFSAGSAHAEAYSNSDAWIDWTSLTIDGDIDWLDEWSESMAQAENDTDFDFNSDMWPGWDDTYASADVIGAFGEAWTDDYELFEAVEAVVYGIDTMGAYSEAEAFRGLDFEAVSDGWVTISVDHFLWQELGTDNIGEEAWGFAEAGLFLGNYDTFDAIDVGTLDNYVSDGGHILDEYHTPLLLEVSVWFNAGEEGYFEAWVYNGAGAFVPEPTTLCLLGIGAVALLKKRRA